MYNTIFFLHFRRKFRKWTPRSVSFIRYGSLIFANDGLPLRLRFTASDYTFHNFLSFIYIFTGSKHYADCKIRLCLVIFCFVKRPCLQHVSHIEVVSYNGGGHRRTKKNNKSVSNKFVSIFHPMGWYLPHNFRMDRYQSNKLCDNILFY